MTDRRPRIAVTLGDPRGIGPEVAAAALADDGRVDAVFSGHTHARYEVDVPRGPDLPMPVVQSGAFSEALARITLTVDPDTREVVAADTGMIELEDYPTRDDETVQRVGQIVADAEELALVTGGKQGPLSPYAVHLDSGDPAMCFSSGGSFNVTSSAASRIKGNYDIAMTCVRLVSEEMFEIDVAGNFDAVGGAVTIPQA